jgi:hypothetical protein
MSPEHKRIIANVITSLREHPEEWQRPAWDQCCTLSHKDGVNLFWANGLFDYCVLIGRDYGRLKLSVPRFGGYRSRLLAAAKTIPILGDPPDAFAPFGSEQEHT